MIRVTLAILLLGLVTTGTALNDICYKELDGTRVPHPADCAKFIVCEQQEIVRMSSCPEGLHFNRFIGECDFKSAAGCELPIPMLRTGKEESTCDCSCCDSCSTEKPGDTTASPTKTTTPPLPPQDGCSNNLTVCEDQPNGSTLPYEPYCNKWITCQGGCSIIQTCPDNLHWVQNPKGNFSYCDYPQNISPACPWPTSPPETGPSGISCVDQGPCTGAKEGATLVDPNNSNLYIVCQCECPISMKCPPGLIFNSNLMVCDWNVSPPDDTTTTQGDTTTTPGDTTTTPGDTTITPGDTKPTPGDTTTTPGDTTTTTGNTTTTPGDTTPTPGDTTPTPGDTTTTPGDTTTTTGDTTTTPGDTTPTPSDTTPTPGDTTTTPPAPPQDGCSNDLTTCKDQLDGTTHPYEPYCNKWIICQGGCSIIQTCPDNLQWVQNPNGNFSYCDYPQNISPACPWPTSPPETGPSGISCVDQGPCAGAKEGATLVDPNNSNLYIVCQCECPISMKCPPGLVFNQNLNVCDWNDSPTQSPTPTPPTPSPPTPSPPTPSPPTPSPPTPSPPTPSPPTPSPPTPSPPTPSPPTPSPPTPSPPTPSPPTPSPPTPSPPTPSPPTPSPPTPTPTPPTPSPPTPSPPTTPGNNGCDNDLKICEDQPNGSTHPYEPYCNKWVSCQGGCSIIGTCPANLQWVQNPNGGSGFCDYPQNINPSCPWPTSPPVTGPSGISCVDQGPCAGAKEGVSFTNPSNSNLYIVCQCECPISMKCPNGLVFNQAKGVCDWPALS